MLFSAPDAAELGHNRLVRRVQRYRGQWALLARNGTQLPVDLSIAGENTPPQKTALRCRRTKRGRK